MSQVTVGVVVNEQARVAGPVGPALLLDRDGVINIDHGYVHSPDRTDWVPGIFDFCRVAVSAGYRPIVVTNQAGIARGFYDEEQFARYTRWVHAEFAARGVEILATYYCPHHAQAGRGAYLIQCGCRKPAPGMLFAAAHDMGVDLAASIMIGDKTSDMWAGDAAGVGTLLLLDPSGEQPAGPSGIRVCASLDEAARALNGRPLGQPG